MRAIGAIEKIASVAAGRMQLAQRGAKCLEVAGDQGVDQVEAGHRRRRAVEHVEPAKRRRRPAEQEVEDIDQHQAGEEHRQRHAGGGGDATEMIDPATRPCRRKHAERQRDRNRDDEAEQGQLGGGRQAIADFGRDRLAGGQRIAEIAMSEILCVAEELLDQRLVEAELLPDLLDRFLGRRGAGEIGRGIAGQRARQQEGDDDDPDQARDREHQSLADQAQHGKRSRRASRARMASERMANRRPLLPFSIRYSLFAIRHSLFAFLTPSPASDSRAGDGTSTDSPRCSSASRR